MLDIDDGNINSLLAKLEKQKSIICIKGKEIQCKIGKYTVKIHCAVKAGRGYFFFKDNHAEIHRGCAIQAKDFNWSFKNFKEKIKPYLKRKPMKFPHPTCNPPDDFDIPVWDVENGRWYDAEY